MSDICWKYHCFKNRTVEKLGNLIDGSLDTHLEAGESQQFLGIVDLEKKIILWWEKENCFLIGGGGGRYKKTTR